MFFVSSLFHSSMSLLSISTSQHLSMSLLSISKSQHSSMSLLSISTSQHSSIHQWGVSEQANKGEQGEGELSGQNVRILKDFSYTQLLIYTNLHSIILNYNYFVYYFIS